MQLSFKHTLPANQQKHNQNAIKMATTILTLRKATPLNDDMIRMITELHLLDLKHQRREKESSCKLVDILETMNFYYIFQVENQLDLKKKMTDIQEIVSENKQYLSKDVLEKTEDLSSVYDKYVLKYEETITADDYEVINHEANDAAEALDESVCIMYDLLTL